MMVIAGNYLRYTMKKKLNSWSVMLGLLAGLVFNSSAGSTLTQKHDNISNQFRVRRMGFVYYAIRFRLADHCNCRDVDQFLNTGLQRGG